ncbi:MAG TPA: phage capsid protein [Candidatus Obscuribacterales bacterium]
MSDLNVTIQQHWVNSFSDTVFELAQQTKARLRELCEFEPIVGANRFLDRVGSVDVQDINTRSPEIVPSDLQWDRRLATPNRVGVAFFVDRRDIERVLTDPKSTYAKRAAQALERDFDRTCISSLAATVFTGQNGTTPVTAATDGVATVDGTPGFTYDLMLQVDQNFQAYEIGTEVGLRKFLLISEQEHAQLMKEGELINKDFTDRAVVDSGKIKQVMDFDVVQFGSKMPIPMLPVTGSVRQCFAAVSGQMKVVMPSTWDIEWQPRNDRWKTDQLLASGERGFVRMQGQGIQIINATAT